MLKFLQALVKMEKPQADLIESIKAAIRSCAGQSNLPISDFASGYKIANNETALVIVQFGGRREFYEMLESMEKADADYRVIITSSNVKSMKIGEMKWLLHNKYQSKNKWLIIDIERKESPKTVNFMLYGGKKEEAPEPEPQPPAPQYADELGYGDYPKEKEKPRKKKIYGVRGQHKEQD